jgi:CheY-like chemotaxis protein/HPt (histidine-containing phosphotransfer) domain-containing protein
MVRDTGIGIPEAIQPRLFTMFSQADSSTSRRYGGSGLGLAISKRIIDRLGGRIDLESREGEGSRFWFEVPIMRMSGTLAAPVDLTAAPLSPPRRDGQPSRKTRLRILVAEDNIINQQVTLGILGSFGCRADLAQDGAEALAMVQQRDYDLVLMDYQMPVMDGLAATKAIRALAAACAKVTIIALTASAMSGDRDQCLAAGMNDYIDKPLDRARLAALLDLWADRLLPDEAPTPLPNPGHSGLAAVPKPVLVAANNGAPPPLIDRRRLDRLKADRGPIAVREQTEHFAAALRSGLGDIAAALGDLDFSTAATAAQALDDAAADLGFARLAALLADLDQGARNRRVTADLVTEAGQVGRRTAEVALLLLET